MPRSPPLLLGTFVVLALALCPIDWRRVTSPLPLAPLLNHPVAALTRQSLHRLQAPFRAAVAAWFHAHPLSTTTPTDPDHPTLTPDSTLRTNNMVSPAGFQVTKRLSKARGHANHGWLDTYHTFSFADYYDPKYAEFGALRVLNEDRVQPQRGFGTHPHRMYEIFSYVVSGELEHKDNLQNVELIRRGDVQFTTAGTGVAHSEKNEHPDQWVHFLQVWVKPDNGYLNPGYVTRHFKDADKANRLLPFVSPYQDVQNAPTGEQSATVLPSTIGVHTDLYAYASILEPGQTVTHKVRPALKRVLSGKGASESSTATRRRAYLHVIDTHGAVTVTGSNDAQVAETKLAPGDGAFITELGSHDEIVLTNPTSDKAEFILFDLA
ncbi:hypothetical protein IWQ60_009462 [Tieghemiomyces parasiticus]|uniref:Pirin N-terminal domain-containing protein n=1 Tax=Tieghemiomyces parasiticus TaxID=78921 RepID=A0A9W8DL38_9FUNG|nr:hypothetical protein IWQ60_009462 [Tieghemiomyces parasiticus]